MSFAINKNTAVTGETAAPPVRNAVRILLRDIDKRFYESGMGGGEIRLIRNNTLGAEEYIIDVDKNAVIYAADELGFVYALLYISERFLGVKPFWFWMDQKLEKSECVQMPEGRYTSPVPAVKYRGWFVNDEVLIMRWSINGDSAEPWRMVFEALLRCGGNLVIPGTDKNSRLWRGLAAEMGLWITHHHAEPLGAEMFLRKFPGEAPDYFKNRDKFISLWEQAVREQKDMKVIWSLGFRGQGDCPFWSSDTSGRYDTPQKQGALISEIIELQKSIVKKYVSDPVFCTNLYGEVTELYDGGHISLTDDIIRICADNGYGRMVARRRGNHNARISSMPQGRLNGCGIYYHVSFYDLQAASHITMLPNSVDFVSGELDKALSRGAYSLWVINCSNVRPHVYFLDALRKKWFGRELCAMTHSSEFAAEYYGGSCGAAKNLREYHSAMLSYGAEEDEHCGEQFYNENVRTAASYYIRGEKGCAEGLKWLAGERPVAEQTAVFCDICKSGLEGLNSYLQSCRKTSAELVGDIKTLFDSTILLQAYIHAGCAQGASLFGRAFAAAEAGEYLKAFMLLGESAEKYESVNRYIRASESGVWKGFYFNECLADIKHTAYMLRKMMGTVREKGDSTSHDKWYRLAVYAPEDREIRTLLVIDNHMTDMELYEEFKKKGTII